MIEFSNDKAYEAKENKNQANNKFEPQQTQHENCGFQTLLALVAAVINVQSTKFLKEFRNSCTSD